MPSPIANPSAPLLIDKSVVDGKMLRSALTGYRCFHKAAGTATAAPTNPYAVLDGTDAQAASCIVTPVPNGANALILFHDYSAASSTLTTVPVIRVWGEVPDIKSLDPYEPPVLSVGPARVAEQTSPVLPSRQWIPLTELSTGNLAITMGTTAAAQTTTTGTWYRSAPVFVSLLGCSRVLVTISTAGVGTTVTATAINGCFNF